jgi:autotransporter family porin
MNKTILRITSLIMAIALTFGIFLPGQADSKAAAAAAAIYGDSLAANWQDWSWDATRNFSNPSPTQSGSRSISVKINVAWGALYLHRSAPQSTAGYSQLEFYVHGGSTGSHRLSVTANQNTSTSYYFTTRANAWTKISIPLSQFGSPGSLSDLFFQDAGGRAQSTFYLDSISLTGSGPAPTATATRPPGTATPPPATATRPPATQTPPSGGRFNLLPPGSTLPSDAACSAAVRSKPENKRMNATYNATRGNQGVGSSFFPSADDPRANSYIAPRITGNYTGTTDQILQWTACKWGFDEDVVRAEAAIESWWRQTTKGDWTTDASRCAPGHGLGVDGTPGQCPESFGILQNRYPYEQAAWPGMYNSTAFNADVTYGILRACYEGYEHWLNDVERGSQYGAGDMWGCVGRWFAGRWHTSAAEGYIVRVQDYLNQRIWESPSFQEP